MRKVSRFAIIIFFILSCFSPLTISCDAEAANGAMRSLDSLVAGGRLPAGIRKKIEQAGRAEILLTLADGDIRKQARRERGQRRLRFDDHGVIVEKARRYRQRARKVLARLQNSDYEVAEEYDNFPVVLMRVNKKSLIALLNMSDVVAVGENRAMHPHLAQSLPLINAPDVLYTGQGTAVAVLDTGVDYTRSAFGSCTAPGVPAGCKVAYAQDFAPSDGVRDDSGYHGTNVSGIVVGVAPDTSILGLDVFDGLSAWDSDILSALNWVLANKDTYNIVAVNMSLGDDIAHFSPCSSDTYAAIITNLKAAGITTVVSSGNESFTSALSSPACVPDAVSVGAVYDANIGSISWTSCTDYSTAADMVTCFSNSASFLTMLAPGAWPITAAGIDKGGTSQAAPHVAGAVAALKQENPALTVDEVVAALTNSGMPVLDSRNSITKPRVDLAAALDFASPVIGYAPVGIDFNVIGGGALPPNQVLNIVNNGGGTLDWSVSDNAAWLDLTPVSGSNAGAVTVSVNTAVLTPGLYSDTITITAPGTVNSPQTAPVSLTVFDPQYAEDFESGGLVTLPWVTGGNGLWYVQNVTNRAGSYAAQSPLMGDSSSSFLEVTLNVTFPGYVYFWLKTSTEPQWDNLKFRIDGVNAGKWDGWYGETGWVQVKSEFEVDTGLHTFRWEYAKDASGSAGSDAVWLDDLVFPPFFDPSCPNSPAMIDSTGYASLAEAYGGALDGKIIKSQALEFLGDVLLDGAKSISLQGGYDCDYTPDSPDIRSSTTINGSLTISSGTVVVENIVIR